MIFFKKEINVPKVFYLEDHDTKTIEKIKKIGKWNNPPEPNTYKNKVMLYAYLHGHNNGLVNNDLNGFVAVLTGLLTEKENSFFSPRPKDIAIENQAINLLESMFYLVPDSAPNVDENKAAALVLFVLRSYLGCNDNELVKKTIMLSENDIIWIKDNMPGTSFSGKIRSLIADYREFEDYKKL